MRWGIAIVGPSVNVGARLLKRIAEGGIIASGDVVEALVTEAPSLASLFRPLDDAFEVPGGIRIATYEIQPLRTVASACESMRHTRDIRDTTAPTV